MINKVTQKRYKLKNIINLENKWINEKKDLKILILFSFIVTIFLLFFGFFIFFIYRSLIYIFNIILFIVFIFIILIIIFIYFYVKYKNHWRLIFEWKNKKPKEMEIYIMNLINYIIMTKKNIINVKEKPRMIKYSNPWKYEYQINSDPNIKLEFKGGDYFDFGYSYSLSIIQMPNSKSDNNAYLNLLQQIDTTINDYYKIY